MLNFDFLVNGLELVSPPHFWYDFSRKIFLILYSVNWTNTIVWLAFLLEILGSKCIVIICFAGCDVIDFEINLSFLSSRFLHDQEFQKFQKLSQTWECAFDKSKS